MELFKLLGTVAIENGDAIKALNGVQKEGEKTESKLGKVFGAIGKGAAAAGKAIAAGLAAGAAAMAGLTIKALQLSGDLEQNLGGAEAVFGELGGTIDKMSTTIITGYDKATGKAITATSNLETVSKEAYKNMGLSQSDYLSTANKMGALFKGAGFETQEALNLSSQAMQRAADVASIMGIDTASAMEAVAGAAKGNFTMMDNLGVAMNETTLANYALEQGMSKSYEQMSQQEKIGVAMEMFLNKTSYAAGNYAKENETLAGSLSTAKSALTNFLAGSGDVDSLVSSFSNLANVVVNNLKEIAPRLATGIADIVNQVAPMLPDLIQSLLPVVIDGAIALVDGLVSAIPGIVSAIQQCLPSLISGFMQLVVGLVQAITEAAPMLIDAVVQGINTLISMLPQLIQSIVSALPVIIPALIDGIISVILTICQNFSAIIQPIIDALPDIIISIVTAIVENLPALIEGIIQLILGIVAAIPQIIQALVDALPTVISLLVQSLLENLPAIIMGLIQVVIGIVQALPQIFMSLIQAVPAALSGIWDGIKNVFANLGSYMGEVVSKVVGYIKELPGKIWDWLKKAASKVVDWGKDIVKNAKDSAKNLVSSVVDFFKELPGKIWEWLQSVVSKIVEWGSNIVTSAKNGASNMVNSVVNFFKELPGKIWEWLSNAVQKVLDFGSKMIDAGKDLVKGIWEGISGAFDWIKKKIKEWVGSVTKFIKKLFGISSPSKVMKNEVGQWLAKGVAEGIIENTEEVESAAEKMAKGVLDAAQKRLDEYSTYNEMTLADEVAFWDGVRTQIEEGTDARLKADQNYLKAKDSLNKELIEAEETLQESLAEIYEKTEEKRQELLDSFSLFDAFELGETTDVNSIFGNMRDQINVLESYGDDIETLRDRIGGTALFEELENMGVESAAYIEMFSEMTDSQLQYYMQLYDTRNELVSQIANSSLAEETFKEETEAWNTYKETCATLGVEVEESMSEISASVGAVGIALVTETANVFTEINDAVSDTASNMVDAVFEACKNVAESLRELGREFTQTLGGGSVGVEWHAKAMNNAMILDSPTIFGYSAKSGNLLGAGEAGSEVVAGSSTLMNMIHSVVAEQNSELSGYMQKMTNMMATYFPQLIEASDRDIVLDSGALVGEMAIPMNKALGKLSNRKDRGR